MGGGVQMSLAGFGLGYAVMSPSGDLVYREESNASQLVYRDALGRLSPALPDTLAFEHPRFSPDGRRIVVTVIDSATHRRTLNLLDRSNGFFSRLGGQDTRAGRDRPEWTPDGQSLLFRTITDSLRSASLRAADGSGADTAVSPTNRTLYEVVMGSDGRTLLGRIEIEGVQRFMWWSRGDSTPRRVLDFDPVNATGARISPNGRWVAFSAEDNGVSHVYVTPFPGPGARVRIDRAGGGVPVWGRDGRSVYYFTAAGLVAASLDLVSGVAVTGTRQLLDAEFVSSDRTHATFDVGPDGTVLFVRQVRDGRLVVVRNFVAEIARANAAQKRP